MNKVRQLLDAQSFETGAAELRIKLDGHGNIEVSHSDGTVLVALKGVQRGSWDKLIQLLINLPAQEVTGEMADRYRPNNDQVVADREAYKPEPGRFTTGEPRGRR